MNTYQIDLAGEVSTVDERGISDALVDYCSAGRKNLVVEELEFVTRDLLCARARNAEGRILPLYVTLLQPNEVPGSIIRRTRVPVSRGSRRDNIEVKTDGFTVWINCVDTQSPLGRFSRHGIDIYREVSQQVSGKSPREASSFTRPRIDDWKAFRELMQNNHGARVPRGYAPNWLTREFASTHI